MKVYNVIFVFLMVFKLSTIAQVKPSINYNSESGNYIIRYQGYSNSVYELTFEPSTKIEPFIKSKVLYVDSVFIYNYVVQNSSLSIQRLEDFNLEIYSSIENITQPDIFWKYSWYSFVPVFGWYNSKGEGGINHPLNGIAPDSSVSGFSFFSEGLPSIVKTFSKGKSQTHLAFPEEPPIDIEQLLKPLTKFPNNTVIKLSIGPKDPAEQLIPEEFLDTLIYYNQRSRELGWIENEKTLNSLMEKLEEAKDHLSKGNSRQTIKLLNDFSKEVEKQNGKKLTSEAFALLYYNAEYLLKQLKK